MRSSNIILITLFIFALTIETSSGQQSHFNGFRGMYDDLYGYLDRSDVQFHTSVQPWLAKEVGHYINADSLYQLNLKKDNKCASRFFNKHAVELRNKNICFSLDPLVDAGMNFDAGGNGLSGGLSAGLSFNADLGKKLTIGGYGSYQQHSFPEYVENYVHEKRVVPGTGYAQRSVFGDHYSWDYDVYANYSFLKYFNLEAGMGRNFWGDGYRSFFLSDNAFSYPYFKITTSVWHLKYVNLYANFKDMSRTSSSRWSNMANKYGSFHFLTWNVTKWLNIGFFEAIVWQEKDSVTNRGFDVSYINPLVFYRPVEFSVGNPDNALMGLSLKIKIAKKFNLYGQFLIDDIIWSNFTKGSYNRIKHWIFKKDSTLAYGYWANKQALQMGFHYYDIFGARNLDVQGELNIARPYTFSHRNVISNYGHYNEPLAHPLGANFYEWLGFLRYRISRLFIESQFAYITVGYDSTGTHFGQDIYKPTFDTYYADIDNIPVKQYHNNIAQGLRNHILYMALRASWLINHSSNLRAEVEMAYRKQSSPAGISSGIIISAGIKTSLFTHRMDF